MDSYPVTDALLDWLDRKGMRGNGAGTPALHGMGAGTKVEDAFAPATAQREGGETRADMNSGKTGSRSPRQVGQGRNVRTIMGETRGVSNGTNYGTHMGTAMAQMAMRHGARVVRCAPWLMVIEGGLSGAHG